MPNKPRIVIIGGGFGGLKAAESLARLPVAITLVDRRNHHTFQPLLYQVATAGSSPAEIAAPIREIMAHHGNVEVLLGEVYGFDLDRRIVKLRRFRTGLRLSRRRSWRQPCVFWTRRMGAPRARPQNH